MIHDDLDLDRVDSADEVAEVMAARCALVMEHGAGDAFAAGCLAAATAGGDIAERLDRASQVAARAVTRVGARPPAPPAPPGS